MNAYGAPSEAPQPWAYPPAPTSMERASQYPPAPVLPSIHSLGRNGSSSNGSTAPVGYNSASASGAGTGEGWHLENQGREDASGMGYRTWQPDASYPAMDNNGVTRPSGAIDPSLRASHAPASSSDVRENSYVPFHPRRRRNSFALQVPTRTVYSGRPARRGAVSREPNLFFGIISTTAAATITSTSITIPLPGSSVRPRSYTAIHYSSFAATYVYEDARRPLVRKRLPFTGRTSHGRHLLSISGPVYPYRRSVASCKSH